MGGGGGSNRIACGPLWWKGVNLLLHACQRDGLDGADKARQAQQRAVKLGLESVCGPGHAKIFEAVRDPRGRREKRLEKAQLMVIDGKRAAVGLAVRVRRPPVSVQQQGIKGENLDRLLLQRLRDRPAVNPNRVRRQQ